MKIGIVTFWNSEDNYGQILQCYALQRFLRDKGHDAFLIRYAPGRKINLKWVLSLPCRIVRKISLRLFRRTEFRFSQRFKEMNRIVRQENAAHPRHFSTFKERFIAVTSRVYDQYDIFTDPPGADAYIAGSDQVWGSVDPVYYLMFVPEGCKKIAYAPSFGGMKLAGSLRKKIKRYISGFDVLALRERQGVEICRELGRSDASLVPDPTLLLSVHDYSSIAAPCLYSQDYLLLYLLGNEIDFDVAEVYAWARSRHIEVKYVASQGRQDAYDKIYPNVDEWLSLIRNARYVVTNSFHGMVFSIIFNKPFVVIPLAGSFTRMNDRIFDTLSAVHLTERIYKNSLDILLDPLDIRAINDYLKQTGNDISLKFDYWLGA